MYRPVQPVPSQQGSSTVKGLFFSEKNHQTLLTVLVQDFQQRNQTQLNEQQLNRLEKTIDHYSDQVYNKLGDKPIPILNKEVLSATAKDFSQYLQRKELTKGKNPVKNVMDESLYQDTSQRFEKLTQERNEVKALPPSVPDFRISLTEDSPPAAVLFEQAKKQREWEALRSSQQNNELVKAESGLQQRIQADQSFRLQQDTQNRSTELALVQRNQIITPTKTDLPLMVLPDRRELLLAPIGSFDTMTQSPEPRELGQSNSNPTIVQPSLASPAINHLPQNNVAREDSIVSYREVENNLFIYSADRDWLRNNKENRYQFTVNFDPAANGQSFGPNLASQQKFKNIVRIELVKAILPGESLDVTVFCSTNGIVTNYQDNILNFPYVTVRVAELENNNYGTDNYLDRSFGVLQYDAAWLSDPANQLSCSRGYLAMIPKFLKCQKEFYPTPLSTLQKMTIDLHRPSGELISTSPDTFDVGGILAPQIGSNTVGANFPFTCAINSSTTVDNIWNTTIPAYPNPDAQPANFFINTMTYFSKFEICPGDRIQISGYTYNEAAFNDQTYGQSLRSFCNWVNQPEGHIVVGTAYTNRVLVNSNEVTVSSGTNPIGYANLVVIQARYKDPSQGTIKIDPFGNNFGATLSAFSTSLQSPIRLINLNKQTTLVFRIITREMDSLPQLRPDNNY
jgi:hypothetical protein